MAGSFLTAALEAWMQRDIRYVRLPAPGQLDAESSQVYAAARAGFGAVVPPVAVHAVVPALLHGFWALSRATLLGGVVPRARKEIIAAGVSLANECPYCVDAHVGSLFTHGDSDSAEALLRGSFSDIRDDQSRMLVEWAAATGCPPGPRLGDRQNAADAAAEILGTAVAFHYLNRVVSVFLPESPFGGPAFVRNLARRNMGILLRPGNRNGPSARTTDETESPLPDCFAWASSTPAVASGLARMDAAVMSLGTQLLSPPLTRTISTYLETWNGEQPALGRQWIETAIGGDVPAHERAAAELGLCVAVAPYRVNAALVHRARSTLRDDQSLFVAVAWSAWQTARRVGSWLA